MYFYCQGYSNAVREDPDPWAGWTHLGQSSNIAEALAAWSGSPRPHTPAVPEATTFGCNWGQRTSSRMSALGGAALMALEAPRGHHGSGERAWGLHLF